MNHARLKNTTAKMAKIWPTFVISSVLILTATLKHRVKPKKDWYTSISLLLVGDVKKCMASFSHFAFFHVGSTRVGRKSSFFRPV